MAGWNTTDIDWTSAATIAPTLARRPYLVLYDIAEALRERCDVLSVVAAPNQIVRGDRRGVVMSLDAKLTSLIPYFVNQTLYSGDYTGQSSIPVWSEALLETAIGISRPASPIRGGQLGSDWAFWTYSALNLLIWTWNYAQGTVSANRREATGDNYTFEDAVDEWDAESWGGWSGYGLDSLIFHYSQYYRPHGTYQVYRAAWRLGERTVTGSAYYKADIYSQLNGYIFDGRYEDNDYGTTDEYQWARIHSDSTERTGNFPAGVAHIGYFDEVTATEPPTDYEISTKGWQAGTSFDSARWRMIRKFDVTGGFDFVSP